MNIAPFNLVLLADVGTVIFFFFAIMSFFGWVGKQIKAANEKAGQQRARREQIGMGGQPRQQPLQNEIDAFLQDVLGQDPQEEAEKERRRREQERQRRQQAAAQRERARVEQKRQQMQKRKPAGAVQPSSLAQRSAEPLAKNLESHVETYMSPHLSHLETHVDQHVQSHLGAAAQDEQPGASRSASPVAQELFSLLQSPQGMRQVVLLNEIFSKPKSQR